jgi:hypothetical protein
MNTACGLRASPSLATSELRDVHASLPVRASGTHRPPLETHVERAPWLPLREAYPELPNPLWVATVAVLSMMAILALVLFVAWLSV